MLWTIFVILLVMWALGLVTSYTMGGFCAYPIGHCPCDSSSQFGSGAKSLGAISVLERNGFYAQSANACRDRSDRSGDRRFCIPGRHLYQPREDYRHWSHPCHRRHSEDHPALTALGRVGTCRRDFLGGGRSQEGVVQLRVQRLGRNQPWMKLRRAGHEEIAMENLLWIVAIAIVATWLAVQILRGRI